MRRADRLIKIVHYLRRMRHAVTARKIADDFGICQRTVYRDIQDLMNSGVPIYGEAGVGYVIDKKYHERFLEGMKRDPEWKLDYEDPLGAIFLRRHPIPNQIRLAGEGGGNE